ncbi:MAG: TIGR00180 family glycosyltransferase [bacterium]
MGFDRSMNLDRRLTIVLTLKGRALFTFRWMAYANRVKVPFKILIADGGNDTEVTEVLSHKDNFPDIEYEYVRYPFDKTYLDYYTKLHDAVSQVKTPFVLMADNDDFYLVESIKQSIDFLQDHQDYSTCRGNLCRFSVKPSEKYGCLSKVYGDYIAIRGSYKNSSILSGSAKERIHEHFLQYSPTYYDIHRTEQLKPCFQKLEELNLKNIFLAELLTSLLTVALGKVKRNPYLYLMRQIGNASVAVSESQKADFFDQMLVESWSEDFSKFVKAIGAAIAIQDKISEDEAQGIVKKAYRRYIDCHISNHSSNFHKIKNQNSHGIKRVRELIGTLKYNSKAREILRTSYSNSPNLIKSRLRRWHLNIDEPSYADVKPVYDFLTSAPPSLGCDAISGGSQ